MNRVIKDYSKLNKLAQEEAYDSFSEGMLERTTFPYKGTITDGVIYEYEDTLYLIPISTIISGRAGSSDDLDDDDVDNDGDDADDIDIEIEDEDDEG